MNDLDLRTCVSSQELNKNTTSYTTSGHLWYPVTEYNQLKHVTCLLYSLMIYCMLHQITLPSSGNIVGTRTKQGKFPK